jgi:hypothetical protein
MDRQRVLDLAHDALEEIVAAPTQLGSPEVLHACGAPLDSLTLAVHASSKDLIYGWLDAWKRQGCPRPDPMMLALGAPDLALTVAALLSLVLEANAPALLAPGTQVLLVPTRTPVVARALAVAQTHGWFSVPARQIATQLGDLSGQRERKLRDRVLRACLAEYEFSEQPAARVLLIDDIWTTGWTMNTFASDLRDHGAIEIHGLAILGLHHYRDAHRLRRQPWTPRRTRYAATGAHLRWRQAS